MRHQLALIRRKAMPLLMLLVICLCTVHQSQSDALNANFGPPGRGKLSESVVRSARSLKARTPVAQLPDSNLLSVTALFNKNFDTTDLPKQPNTEVKTEEPPSSLDSINILMFLFYGVLGTVLPFLPTFYKNLGVPDSLIGVLGAITPAVTFLVSPLWGALADSTGLHKEIMLITFLGSILSRTALIWCNSNVIWLSFVVALSASLSAPVKPLLDSAVMSMLSDKSAYGKSRLFGQVGIGMGSFLVGPMVSSNSKMMFLVQLLLAAPTAYLMTRFQPKKQSLRKEGDVNMIQALNHTLKDFKVSVFFMLIFIIGVSSGIIENFAYIQLNKLQGSQRILGILRLCSSLAGGPMFWISGEIIKLIGVNGVLNLSLLSYILRFMNYATAKSAWFALPAEILRGLSFAMFWSGATYYVYGISPKGLTATMLGFLNAIYGGIGQSLGSLIGGYLSKHFGIEKTFKYCAVVDFVILAVFLLYQRITDFNQMNNPPAPEVTTRVKTSFFGNLIGGQSSLLHPSAVQKNNSSTNSSKNSDNDKNSNKLTKDTVR